MVALYLASSVVLQVSRYGGGSGRGLLPRVILVNQARTKIFLVQIPKDPGDLWLVGVSLLPMNFRFGQRINFFGFLTTHRKREFLLGKLIFLVRRRKSYTIFV